MNRRALSVLSVLAPTACSSDGDGSVRAADAAPDAVLPPPPLGHCAAVGPEVTFCDDFDGDALDTSRWWYGHRHWGPRPPRTHGVVPENVTTSVSHIPWLKSRLTLGTWFPEWAGGVADFDVEHLELDWVTFAPFDEPNDEPNDEVVPETYVGDGLTRCHDKTSNDAYLPACGITVH